MQGSLTRVTLAVTMLSFTKQVVPFQVLCELGLHGSLGDLGDGRENGDGPGARRVRCSELPLGYRGYDGMLPGCWYSAGLQTGVHYIEHDMSRSMEKSLIVMNE